MWHMTRYMWHMTCDTWWGVNSLSKCQLFSSYGLGQTVSWRFWTKGSFNEWMNELITKLFIEQPRLTGSVNKYYKCDYKGDINKHNLNNPTTSISILYPLTLFNIIKYHLMFSRIVPYHPTASLQIPFNTILYKQTLSKILQWHKVSTQTMPYHPNHQISSNNLKYHQTMEYYLKLQHFYLNYLSLKILE